MAAAVVTVIVKDILQSLEEGMKLGQQRGVKPEHLQIHDLLSSIVGELPEAENKYGHSFELQQWVQNLKQAAFDAEDLLEELSTEDALWQRKTTVRRLFRAVDRLMFRRRMRAGLRAVTRQLQDLIRSDWIDLLRNIPDEIGETHEAAGAVPLIGRGRDKRELMGHLLHMGGERKRELPALIVRGSTGTGKTSLVQELCSESGLNRHFDDIIWVNAPPPFDENRMARDIVASLTNGVATEEENVAEDQSLVRVRKLLDGRKKYLFILEDLSFDESERRRWLRFLSFLEGGATGSKILITSRGSVKITNEEYVFYLDCLIQDDPRYLLLKTAFKGGEKETIDPAKLQIAEDVAAKCYGNPMDIRAVGEYLSLQHSARDWSYFRDRFDNSVLFTLVYGGYPYGHLSPMVNKYHNLPPRIKQCFGLCSLFPRGHSIDRQTLSDLWIALGYIKSSNKDHQPLEDIAEDYFNRLLMEELLRVEKFDTFGKVRSVVLLADAENLARSVAGWECAACRYDEYFLKKRVENGRHLSVIDYWSFLLYRFDFRSQRTVLYFGDDHRTAEFLCNNLIPRIRHALARVLDVHNLNVEAVPKAIWKLTHLRYLNLSDNRRIKMLPSEITDLLNLQTLKLSGCWALKELPQDIQKLVSLRHLYIDGCWKLCLMPKGLGDLKFLSILTDFILPPDDSCSADSANLADLCKLNNIRGSLRITNLSYSEAARERFKIPGLLDDKSSLESLELIFSNLLTDESVLNNLRPHQNLKGLRIHNYGATFFPEWMARPQTYLPNIVEVSLIGCENCECLPQFGRLHHLKSLSIQGLPDLLRMESGHELSSPDVANNARPFSELSSLFIRDCPKLEFLPMIPHLAKLTLENVSKQLFGHPFCIASLKTLRLENIELLDHLPEHWLDDLTSLKELHIGNCPSLVSLSRGIKHLENLESFSIWNCKNLHLSKDEHDNVLMELQGLKSLKFLTIYKASKMEHLPDWLSDVYSLRFLFIRSCPNLVALPEWIGNLGSLKLIELVHCPRLTSLPAQMYGFNDDYPRKLTIIGCPHLQSDGIEHSRKL